MEWKLIRGRERKNLHGAHHVCLEGKHIHGTCLPCTASTPVNRHPLLFWATAALAISALVHRRPLLLTGARRSAGHLRPAPIVLLRIGNRQSAGNRCSTLFLSLVNFCMVFAAGVPVAPSHIVCFQGMSTCHQRPGLSTVAR